LEPPAGRGFIARRLDRRVSEIWALAADDPDLALARARALRTWLSNHPMTGEAEKYRKVFIAQLADLIRFLTS
jgi:hypothetical protein